MASSTNTEVCGIEMTPELKDSLDALRRVVYPTPHLSVQNAAMAISPSTQAVCSSMPCSTVEEIAAAAANACTITYVKRKRYDAEEAKKKAVKLAKEAAAAEQYAKVLFEEYLKAKAEAIAQGVPV